MLGAEIYRLAILGTSSWAFQVLNLPAHARDTEMQVRPLGWEDPRSRKWQPTPAFLPGEPYGQRSLVGCSLWGHKESDKAEYGTHTYTHPLGT